MDRVELDARDFFADLGEPPAHEYSSRVCGDYGPQEIEVRFADGQEFRSSLSIAFRSPYNPAVVQVRLSDINSWADGTAMSELERRQVAQIVCSHEESQLWR